MLTIAIIEDNIEFAYVLANYLKEQKDFCITGVYHYVDDALKGIRNIHPDIVIVDIELHGLSGIELIKRMKLFGGDIKYLVLTMHDDEATAMNALQAGANGYMLKDAHPEKITEALHELANGGSPVSSFIFNKLIKHFLLQPKKESYCHLLSFREKEILQQVSRGLLHKEIAILLGIQRETVKKHLSKIYGKLKVQNKIEAINKFFG